MNKTYIAILVLIVLAVGAVLVFGTGKKAEAPVGETQSENTQSNDSNQTNIQTNNASNPTLNVGVTVGAVKEFTVTGKNFSFTPSLITVKKGDKVKITFNNTNGFHDFKIDEFGVATTQKQAPDTEVLEFTATKTGTFEYYCSVGSHRQMGMKGTLLVE